MPLKQQLEQDIEIKEFPLIYRIMYIIEGGIILNYIIEFNECSTDDPERLTSDDCEKVDKSNNKKESKNKMKPVDKSENLNPKKYISKTDDPKRWNINND